MRLLDGECAAEERERLERHLTGCQTCAGRRQALYLLNGAVRQALATADPAARPRVGAELAAPLHAPSRRAGLVGLWRAPALRVAAALLALAAVAATAQPVRKWIAARWEQLRAIVAPPAPPELRAPGAAEVRFTPAGAVFTIEVTARQAAGRLTVEMVADSIASAVVTGGDGSEELVVLPERLRILNRATTTASYAVLMPDGVREVRLQIGTGPVRRLVTTADAHWVIEMVSGTEVPARP